jgi:phenylalanyl-tRNA synthetase beta chain
MAGRARRYSAHSDAAHRFERGVDPELAPVALERATALITAICGGDAGPADDHVAAQHLPTPAHVTLRGERLRRLLGYAPPDSEVETLLQRLGLDVEADAAGWRTSVPSWRYDLLREEDLVEEVARVHGYNRAPRTHPAHTARIAPRSEQRRDAEALADSLVERGYHETVSYSFVDAAVEAEINPAAEPLALANPIASDLGVMRTSLWPGLLRTAAHNLNRQQERARLFERGVRFFAGDDGGLEQSEGLGLLAMGPRWPEQWSGDRTPVDFFDVKGDLEGLLAPLDSGRYRFVAAHHPALHPGQSARIEHAGTPIGWIGTLHPRLQQRLALTRAPVLAEVALAPLLEQPLPQFESVSKFPAIRRDLAVIVDDEVPAAALVESARAAAPAELREVFVFDVYRGQGVDSGRKSIALGLILQGFSRTLTDSEVDRASHDVLNGLHGSHGATLRE